MSRNDDYTTGNLLDFCMIKCIVNVSVLSKQNIMSFLQKNNFVSKLEEDDGATIFFYHWKAPKNYCKLFFNFINCLRII